MRENDILEALFWTISWRREMAELGRLYLAKHPEEANIGQLRSLVLFDPGIFGLDVSVSGARRALSERVQRDFDNGDMVELVSWHFARTEARFGALFRLLETTS
jgi:hypothetical protein